MHVKVLVVVAAVSWAAGAAGATAVAGLDVADLEVALPGPTLPAPALPALNSAQPGPLSERVAAPMPDAAPIAPRALVREVLALAPIPLLPGGVLLLSVEGAVPIGTPLHGLVLDVDALPAPQYAPHAPRLAPEPAPAAAPAPTAIPAPESAPPAVAASSARMVAAASAPTVARVAAAGTVAAGLAALLGLALYSRIRPRAALENDTRKAIFDAVCAEPGLGVVQISETAGVSYSTTTYHLDRLVQAGMVVMTPDGNKLCYYKNGGAFTETERKVLPLLKNDEAARLLEAILEEPGTYRAALAERLGVTATTINWHLKRLRGAGLIRERREGRNAFLFANTDTLRPCLEGLAQKLGAGELAVVTRFRAQADRAVALE